MKTRAWWAGLTDDDFVVEPEMPENTMILTLKARPISWGGMSLGEQVRWVGLHSAFVFNIEPPLSDGKENDEDLTT